MARVTIADVAREAGVSLMTVSRAVNNKSGLSDATRERILEIVDRLGYRPNTIARGLVTKRTGTLGLVVPDNANPFFSEIAQGVEHAAYAEGYNVFLCNTEEDKDRELAVLHSLSEKLVDGVIVCSPRLPEADLEEALAFYNASVLINRTLNKGCATTLRIHDVEGGLIAVNHLIQSGHRAIGFLPGPEDSFSGQQRSVGYRLALENAGMPYNPDWVTHCLPMVETGQETAHNLLTDNTEITALFCYNDLVAIGALKACADLGYRVPEDIAIVGFDDIMLASLVTPPLTTCRVPRYQLGMEAAQLVLAQVDGEPIQVDKLIEPELIIRASAP
jgi:LacI family transcriptional regulator